MSGRDERVPSVPAAASHVAEKTVVDYLRQDPEFLLRHPELLEHLVVPHACGDAVSLVEHQVSVLQDRCTELRRRLKNLVENARGNQELSQRLHRLILGLIGSPGLDEIFTVLYQTLEEGFGVEWVSLRLFAEPAAAADRGLGELVGASHPAQSLFADAFDPPLPVCGRLHPEQLSFLFGERARAVRSGALIPFVAGARRGVLAIGSRDPRRFHAGMGTLYLRQLADVLGGVLREQVL